MAVIDEIIREAESVATKATQMARRLERLRALVPEAAPRTRARAALFRSFLDIVEATDSLPDDTEAITEAIDVATEQLGTDTKAHGRQR